MTTVIKVEQLGKKYIIWHDSTERPETIKESISAGIKAITERVTSPFKYGMATKARSQKEEFSALENINFEVKQGERIGLIGRNGAGKTTLLKALSRITSPSSGKISIKGRVASLLAVGTGFHPELTGKENIYLNGAVLGMKRSETKRKYDEIVDFAGVEKFIDTPVKRYSSGMYVRLAFAVAAHLEPEILLVDEVLAVGDLAFQKKCLGKMEDVSKQGRTIIFVSHNMSAVSSLCQKGILLDSGKIVEIGDMQDVITTYRKKIFDKREVSEITTSPFDDFEITKITVLDSKGKPAEQVASGENISIRFAYRSNKKTSGSASIRYILSDDQHNRLFCCATKETNNEFIIDQSEGYITLEIPKLPLLPGEYEHNFTAYLDGGRSHKCLNFGSLLVTEGYFFKTGALPKRSEGSMLVDHDWKIENKSDLNRSG